MILAKSFDFDKDMAAADAKIGALADGTSTDFSAAKARGKPVDKRADIWAFGCVLYEMLTGARPFRGETVSETLADVMKSEPPWTALPSETPATLRNVVRRCLEKDPRQRVHDIADVRLALEGAFETAAAVGITAVASLGGSGSGCCRSRSPSSP